MSDSRGRASRSFPVPFERTRPGPLILALLLAACNGPAELPERAADPSEQSDDSAVALPSFEDYPATETFGGDPAPVDLDSHPEARTYRTALTRDAEAGAESARFAGHYRIVVIGCGASCKSVWAVDLTDGRVHSLFTASYSVAYRPDSRLIVGNDPAAYESLLEETPAADVEQLIRTYGPPQFWIEKDGTFERIGPWEARLDPEAGKLVAALPGSAGAPWQCTTDLEILCAMGACEASTGSAFTPMSVTVDGSGALTVCAYTGCWEGTGRVVESGRFVMLASHGLEFSTADDPRFGRADIAIVIDRADGIATLKAAEFAQPMLCERVG